MRCGRHPPHRSRRRPARLLRLGHPAFGEHGQVRAASGSRKRRHGESPRIEVRHGLVAVHSRDTALHVGLRKQPVDTWDRAGGGLRGTTRSLGKIPLGVELHLLTPAFCVGDTEISAFDCSDHRPVVTRLGLLLQRAIVHLKRSGTSEALADFTVDLHAGWVTRRSIARSGERPPHDSLELVAVVEAPRGDDELLEIQGFSVKPRLD